MLKSASRRSGGIGRRKGLKIPRAQKARTGSIPVSGTIFNDLRKVSLFRYIRETLYYCASSVTVLDCSTAFASRSCNVARRFNPSAKSDSLTIAYRL
jgi:hypothetical protein